MMRDLRNNSFWGHEIQLIGSDRRKQTDSCSLLYAGNIHQRWELFPFFGPTVATGVETKDGP